MTLRYPFRLLRGFFDGQEVYCSEWAMGTVMNADGQVCCYAFILKDGLMYLEPTYVL